MAADLTNYYILARRAIYDEEYNDAIEIYRTILINNPNDWEANFYTYYAKAELADFSDLDDKLDNFANAVYNIFSLLAQTPMPDKWKTQHILQCSRYMLTMPVKTLLKYYDANRMAIINQTFIEIQKCVNLLSCYRLCYTYCDAIEFYFANNTTVLKDLLALRKFLAENHRNEHQNYFKEDYTEDSEFYLNKNIEKLQSLSLKLNS